MKNVNYVTPILFPDPNGMDSACNLLRGDGLVAFATETVYGLGANACSDLAVAKIYAAKGRPAFNPLIVHIASLEQAEKLAVFHDQARDLALQFWPGPLTLVLPLAKQTRLSPQVTAGLTSVALRISQSPHRFGFVASMRPAPSGSICQSFGAGKSDLGRACVGGAGWQN